MRRLLLPVIMPVSSIFRENHTGRKTHGAFLAANGNTIHPLHSTYKQRAAGNKQTSNQPSF
jgi:hypothetical protein